MNTASEQVIWLETMVSFIISRLEENYCHPVYISIATVSGSKILLYRKGDCESFVKSKFNVKEETVTSILGSRGELLDYDRFISLI